MVMAGGILIAALIGEIGLRLIGYSYPIFYMPHNVRGYTPIPKMEGWSWDETPVYVRYNSDGFRDVDHTVEKPPGTVRIAFIGDSFTEGRQVPLESTYWKVGEGLLNADPDLKAKRVEVLAFAAEGYGTVEELLMLRENVWRYSPDIVVIGFCVYNDVTDNYQKFKGATEIPYFRPENGELVYDDSFRESRKFKRSTSAWFTAWVAMHNHCRVMQLLHHVQFTMRTRLNQWKQGNVSEPNVAMDPAGSPAKLTNAQLVDVVGLPNVLYRPPDDADWEGAWDVTEALLSQMGREVAEHNAKFLIMTISSDIQVVPNAALRQDMMRKLDVPDLFYPNRRLAALSEQESIDFLDVAPQMQSAADNEKIYFHGFGQQLGTGHWNKDGNEFAGKLLAEKLEKMLPE
jgi:hypothetical protein